MGTRPSCICGGRAGRWPPPGLCCWRCCCPTPANRPCPDEFRTQARAVLLNLPGRPDRWDDELRTDAGLRRALPDFIADFANWDNAAKPAYLAAGRALAQAAHTDETPLVVALFAGGVPPFGSPAAGLRRLRQRSQPSCRPHPQNAAGGHFPAGAGTGRRTARSRRQNQGASRGGAGGPLSLGPGRHPRTRTAPRPLPTCGRAWCVAKAPTAALKSRCCAPCGCAGNPGASGPCAPTLSGRWGHHPGGVRNLGARVRPGSRRRQRGPRPCHLPGLQNRAAAGDGCAPSWPPSAAAAMRCLTNRATAPAARG